MLLLPCLHDPRTQPLCISPEIGAMVLIDTRGRNEITHTLDLIKISLRDLYELQGPSYKVK